ncbi:hypothetical protein J6590_077774 [Homalodisca vitripennis]|nr:hypothetical protein J6590_077774 [Homalodisca vitripennis]
MNCHRNNTGNASITELVTEKADKPLKRSDLDRRLLASSAPHAAETSTTFRMALLISEIQPVNTMKRASQAGIHGVRAAVFMEYGHRGNIIGLTEAMKAVEIDRTNGEWHFLVGKCMGSSHSLSTVQVVSFALHLVGALGPQDNTPYSLSGLLEHIRDEQRSPGKKNSALS